MFFQHARGAGIHGDVLNVYTVKGEGERVGRGSRQPRVFSSVKQLFFDIS